MRRIRALTRHSNSYRLPTRKVRCGLKRNGASASWPRRRCSGLRQAVRKAELSASRANADKVPDPTLGVFTSSEAFRNERVVGISISIPLSGTYRDELVRQSLQAAEVARAALDRERQAIDIEIAETHADAIGSVARWRLAEQGAEAARENARLTQRAYTLGEADLQSLLLIRRQALDAARAAVESRADALRWNYRLLIDANLIWGLANE